MTTTTAIIWHCDAGGCTRSATEKTSGWTSAVYTHGCPDHGDVITAHKATVTGDDRSAVWRLVCACGWVPSPSWAKHSACDLKAQHVAHVAAATPADL